jgi:hypothetical protein
LSRGRSDEGSNRDTSNSVLKFPVKNTKPKFDESWSVDPRHQLARNSLDKLRALHLILKAGFRPDQARVPAGNPDGGQWTDEGGSTRPQRVSGRGGTRGSRSGGRWPEASPGQQTRLAISQFQMRAALEKVRSVDPRWRPTPQAYETIEGQIGANVAVTREAQSRYAELQAKGLVPGRYAVESIPARGPGRNFTAQERRELNRIGQKYGCHTCGTRDPGTISRNFVGDHQPLSSSNRSNARQALYPHCLLCSLRQGGWSKELMKAW